MATSATRDMPAVSRGDSYPMWNTRPEWASAVLGQAFSMSGAVFADSVVVTRSSGFAAATDMPAYEELIKDIVKRGIGDDRHYAHVMDMRSLKGGSVGARRRIIGFMRGRRQLKCLIIVKASAFMRVSISVARRFYSAGFTVEFANSLSSGIAGAAVALGMPESVVRAAEVTRWPIMPSPAASGPPAGAKMADTELGDAEYEFHSVIQGRDVLFTRSRGYFRTRHVAAVIARKREMLPKLAANGPPYFMVTDVSDVHGGSFAARRQFVDGLRRVHRDYPFERFVFVGAKGVPRTAIMLARWVVPFHVDLVNTRAEAMALIQTARTAYHRRHPSPDSVRPRIGTSPETDSYVDDILGYLAAIDWDPQRQGDLPEWTPGHPFAPVFEAIELLRADVSSLFQQRDAAELERQDLEERLGRARKMEALGLLAGGVAHDLNNVLGGIIGYPDLLLMDMPPDSPLRRPVQSIRDSGEKAAAIVQDLLTLTRRGVPVAEPVAINELVDEYLASPEFIALSKRSPRVSIQTHLDPNAHPMVGSSMHLKKALMNLISNAFEASDGMGTVVVRTENRSLDQPLPGHDQMTPGDFIMLEIVDSGRGIASDDLNRIFEPFFTTKMMGSSGTGLGMAVVWGTVQDHQGHIDVTSEIDQGTHFRLFFPADRHADTLDNDLTAESLFYGNGERVLVVDDVPEQRAIAKAILERLGYRVAEAADGEAAVAYVQDQIVDLVMLDMIMPPGIDGLETYRRIQRIRPGQRALIVSGFADGQRVAVARQLGVGAFLKKPYALVDLGRVVRELLDGDPAHHPALTVISTGLET